MIPCGFCGQENKNKKWCNASCCGAQWRLDHPRVGEPHVGEAVCGSDLIKRDTKKTWARYMNKNPAVFEDTCRVPYSPINVKKEIVSMPGLS